MAKKTRRRRSKKRRPDFFQTNKYWLVTMAVAGLIVVSLVVFARYEEQPAPPAVPPVAKPVEKPVEKLVQKPVVDYMKKVHAEVEALLAANGNTQPRRELTPSPARYRVEGDLPSEELIKGFRQRLAGFPGQYGVTVQETGSVVVEKSGQPVVVIQFSPPAVELPDGPLVAIIMDDLGRSTYTAQALVAIPQHVTFSILPGESQAGKVAELAYQSGREIMLHVPMEPQGYPAVNPGDDALFIRYSESEIRNRFDELLSSIPHATGSNNHMGSRFTENAEALAPVMQSLSEKGLFFIDSRTTGKTQVTNVANKYGVPTLSRDVFLDNVADVDAIVVQLGKLEARARRKGMAIGICHPYPETIEALRKTLPEQAGRGINFVPVSKLLQRQTRL